MMIVCGGYERRLQTAEADLKAARRSSMSFDVSDIVTPNEIDRSCGHTDNNQT